MSQSSFNVSRGLVHGFKQVTFYFCDKPNLAQLLRAAEQEFPGVPLEKLNVLPGYANVIITEGPDFDVPKS